MGNEKPKWMPIGQIKEVRGHIDEELDNGRELREGSINRIMEMDDMELAMRTLKGEIGQPKGF